MIGVLASPSKEMSLQILERFALNDPSAIELFKSLYKKHKTLMDQVDKH